MYDRIMIISNSISGLINFREMLLIELKKRCKNAVVVVPCLKDKKDIECIEKLKMMKYTVVQFPMSRRGKNVLEDFRLFCNYRKIIKDKNPDLVITYTIKPNIYAGINCRMMKIPYAINITGLGSAFEGDILLRKVAIILNKLACKSAKVVFFENVDNRNKFINWGIVKETQAVTLNGAGVDLNKFKISEYPPGEKIKFLFIGRIMAEKGINELFEAMQRLVDKGFKCELHILGECEENYKKQIEKGEKEGWLKYYGFQRDVRPFIKEIHCFILPSWHEGMANTNLECAATGRPVITSNIPGCREAVIDCKTGYLVEKKNVDALCCAMEKFMNLSYQERKRMGLCGRKFMEEKFDKRNVVIETVSHL